VQHTNTHSNADGNTHTHANANANANADSDSYADSNSEAYTYAKDVTRTEASSHTGASPIADKRLATNVKWLGTREKTSRVSQLPR
jgi:hypothetical protein